MIKGLQSFSTDFNDSYQFRIVTPGCRLFEATVVRKLTLRFGTSLGWDLFNIANIFPIIKIFSLNLLHLMNWPCVPFYAPSPYKLLSTVGPLVLSSYSSLRVITPLTSLSCFLL